MMSNEIAVYTELEDAEFCIKKLLKKDCNMIGITDQKIINQIFEARQHRYDIIPHEVFEERGRLVGVDGFGVCIKDLGQA